MRLVQPSSFGGTGAAAPGPRLRRTMGGRKVTVRLGVLLAAAAMAALLLLRPAPCGAGVLHDEAVAGDLSNNPSAPTAYTLATGVNAVIGSLNGSGGDSQDWIAVTVPIMGDPSIAAGSQGFTPPLGAGTYTFLFQQLGTLTSYQFDFGVTPVPEPATCAVLAGPATWLLSRRKRG